MRERWQEVETEQWSARRGRYGLGSAGSHQDEERARPCRRLWQQHSMDDESLASCEELDKGDSAADRRQQMMRAAPSLVLRARAQFGLRPAERRQEEQQ